MTDYLTANRAKIKAIIGLGDLVTGSIKRVFDQVGVKPGEIPVVGWGNSLDTTQEVLDGYVNAAQWQDPQATSYLALSLAADGSRAAFRPGFNIITGALYEKDTAQRLRRDPVRASRPDRDRRRPRRRPRALPSRATPRQCHERSPTVRPQRPGLRGTTSLIQRLIARPEFGPFVLLVARARRLHGDQPGVPVAAQHQQHARPSPSSSA